jgi:1,4-dihydroxy-2-naphthoate octaprenyltransferase
MTLRKLIAFIILTRPLFLAGAAILYLLGVFFARSQGITLDVSRVLLGQAIITSIQLMTHYSNEYYDLETDRLTGADRTFFSGGSGVLPSGILAPQVARRAMIVCAIVGLVFIAIATTQVSLIAPLSLIGMISAWFYSAPPIRLVGTGWGELSSAIIVTVLTPLIGYGFQAGRIDFGVLAICLPLMLLYLSMVVGFEMPDFAADAATNKRTLTVRWGKNAAGGLEVASMALAFIVIALLANNSTRFIWFLLPLAIWQIVGVLWRMKHRWTHLGLFTFGGLALFALTAAAWLIGFII